MNPCPARGWLRVFLAAAVTVGLVAPLGCSSQKEPPAARPAPARPPVAGNHQPPADHTKVKDGVHHKPGYKKPAGECTPCHGERLEGSATAPPCTACHRVTWKE